MLPANTALPMLAFNCPLTEPVVEFALTVKLPERLSAARRSLPKSSVALVMVNVVEFAPAVTANEPDTCCPRIFSVTSVLLRLNVPLLTVAVNAPAATETPPPLKATAPVIVPLMPVSSIVRSPDASENTVEPNVAATFAPVTATTVPPLESCA